MKQHCKPVFFLLAILLCIQYSAVAQYARFVKSGTIHFEKKVNVLARMKKKIGNGDTWGQKIYDEYKKTKPPIQTVQQELLFSNDRALYRNVATEDADNVSSFVRDPAISIKQQTLTDFGKSAFISEKKLFEETFLVTDSIRPIKWKITSETRDIAGYRCRRANGLVMDSIYVVAFYTDQIAVSGGPESFCGLPGMILGLALPYEHTTWFATKVTDEQMPPEKLVINSKKERIQRKQLFERLKKSFADWGNYANDLLVIMML